jgi:hypothetical protein
MQLARGAGAHKVLDQCTRARDEEVGADVVKCLLHAFVSRAVRTRQDVWHTWQGGGDEDAAAQRDDVVDDRPLAGAGSFLDLLSEGHHGRVRR